MRVVAVLSLCLTLMSCAGGEEAPTGAARSATAPSAVYCFDDGSRAAMRKLEGACQAPERRITESQFAAFVGSRTVPSMTTQPKGDAFYCFTRTARARTAEWGHASGWRSGLRRPTTRPMSDPASIPTMASCTRLSRSGSPTALTPRTVRSAPAFTNSAYRAKSASIASNSSPKEAASVEPRLQGRVMRSYASRLSQKLEPAYQMPPRPAADDR